MQATRPFYTKSPLTKCFGVEAVGLDWSSAELTTTDLVREVKADLRDHRLLLFRGQHFTGARQVQISSFLGELKSTFYKHKKSPHPDIFRVSNCEDEGCTGVGRTGWHVDGTFIDAPFQYQTMHFPSVCAGGDTWFIPLKELYESQTTETRQRWDRLWMLSGRQSGDVVHPLVCRHPVRRDATMVFHCGAPFVAGWFMDDPGAEESVENPPHVLAQIIDARKVQLELEAAIENKMDDLGLVMKWRAGDFAIVDNLGLAHYASTGTQTDWRAGGLRVLHRTTVSGARDTIPKKSDGRKSYRLPASD
eukprot:Selendium_serpulae@DN265_c0_g1_i1.p1